MHFNKILSGFYARMFEKQWYKAPLQGGAILQGKTLLMWEFFFRIEPGPGTGRWRVRLVQVYDLNCFQTLAAQAPSGKGFKILESRVIHLFCFQLRTVANYKIFVIRKHSSISTVTHTHSAESNQKVHLPPSPFFYRCTRHPWCLFL